MEFCPFRTSCGTPDTFRTIYHHSKFSPLADNVVHILTTFFFLPPRHSDIVFLCVDYFTLIVRFNTLRLISNYRKHLIKSCATNVGASSYKGQRVSDIGEMGIGVTIFIGL